MESSILLIDDDAKLAALLGDYLKRFEMTVKHCTDPREGLEAYRQGRHDAVVLDVMMPRMDGFEVCRRMHEFPGAPILMLTARGEVADKVLGLEIGADDYLAKPFEPRELAARLQALIRRAADNGPGPAAADIRLNFKTGRAERADTTGKVTDLLLTDTEFAVLAELVKRRPEPVSRDRLFELMRGIERDLYDRSIDILISRLRGKLGDNRLEPKYIRTIRLVGYAFIG